VTIREIGDLIGALAERSQLIALGELPSSPTDPKFICANTSKLRAGTDWRPRFDLETGLRDTIEWWRRQGARSSPARSGLEA